MGCVAPWIISEFDPLKLYWGGGVNAKIQAVSVSQANSNTTD